jgi:tyrosyl-DNA phosphodiesterase 2
MACISMSDMNNHKCIERAADSDCPICNEYLLNSPKSVMFMQCGHSIHLACFEELKKTSYRCPLCNKSCVNMEYHFRQLDMHILQQPMPPDYADARAVISCNDCCAKSQTAFHWLGLKCAVCRSYNTVQLQLLNMPGEQQEQQLQQYLPQQGGQQPVALDPALLTEEIRRRNRAARREEARQRRDSTNQHNNFQGFALLSTSPSSYSPAFLLRLLNRSYAPESDHAGPSSTPSSDVKKTRAASSSSPLTLAPAVTKTATAPETACDSADDDDGDDDEADDEDLDMLDLFGARDREFDRMTGLTSAESAVEFDDDDEEEESSEEEGDGEGENEEDEEDEDEDEDDILLLGHR